MGSHGAAPLMERLQLFLMNLHMQMESDLSRAAGSEGSGLEIQPVMEAQTLRGISPCGAQNEVDHEAFLRFGMRVVIVACLRTSRSSHGAAGTFWRVNQGDPYANERSDPTSLAAAAQSESLLGGKNLRVTSLRDTSLRETSLR